MIKFRMISTASIVLMAAAFGASARAGIVTQWNFENNSVAVNNNPLASTGTGVASSLGMNLYATPNVGVTTDDVLVGKTSDTGNNGVADTTNVWRIRAQAGANGAANGWSSQAPIGTQGAQFTTSTSGLTAANTNSITVSFDWYATTQGEANLQLQYTTDGTTYKNLAITLGGADAGLSVLTNTTSANTVIGSYVSDNLLTNSAGGQDWFTGLTATITDANALNNANFGIRIVNASTGVDDISTQGTALNNSSGNWRFDNVTITANPNLSSVPEPSSLVMLGMASVAGLVVHRVRRRHALAA